MMIEQKPHISQTQISMIARCPELYHQVYVLGRRQPPGIAQLTGTGYHGGAETNFRQKIESHRDLPADQIIEAAVARFESELAGGYSLSKEEVGRGAKVVLGEAKDSVAELTKCYAADVAPDYQPVAVEHSTHIVLPKASHDLLAITDLRDDQDRVVDLKTASRKPPQQEADDSIQLTVYAAAFHKDVGRPPAEVRLDVVTKTKKPTRHVLVSQRGPADYQALVNRINAMLAMLEAFTEKGLEVWPGAPIGAWWCSDRFCGFWKTCPLVNSERKTV